MEIKTWQDIVNRCRIEAFENMTLQQLGDTEFSDYPLPNEVLQRVIRRAIHTWQSALRDVPIGSELMSVLLPGMSES